MNTPLVSILIPVYNREKMIARALDSALSQTYTNIEIVVTDNCSTDKTFEVVQEYAQRDRRIRCFRNEENLGPLPNWQRCLNYSKGDYIKILWSDDWMEACTVEKLIAPLLSDPTIGFSYSTTLVNYDDGSATRYYDLGKEGCYPSYDFLRLWLKDWTLIPVSPGCGLFRRECVMKAFFAKVSNPYNLNGVKYGIPYDFLTFLTSCSSYEKFYFFQQPFAYFAEHKGSFSASLERNDPGFLFRCYLCGAVYALANLYPVDVARKLLAILFMQQVLFRLRPSLSERIMDYKKLVNSQELPSFKEVITHPDFGALIYQFLSSRLQNIKVNFKNSKDASVFK